MGEVMNSSRHSILINFHPSFHSPISWTDPWFSINFRLFNDPTRINNYMYSSSSQCFCPFLSSQHFITWIISYINFSFTQEINLWQFASEIAIHIPIRPFSYGNQFPTRLKPPNKATSKWFLASRGS